MDESKTKPDMEDEEHRLEDSHPKTPTDLLGDDSREDGSVEESSTDRNLEDEKNRLHNELLYLRADFDNYKKRSLKDQEQLVKFSNERLIRELLTVVDLFERGLPHGQVLAKRQGAEKDILNFVTGIEMTHRELTQLLGRFGVELIGAVGEKFDPSRHEAISQLEGAEYSEDTVAQVLQRGCLLHGRLLVPAKVAVGKTNEVSG